MKAPSRATLSPRERAVAERRAEFRPKEWAVVQKYRTPLQVQAFLRDLPYNWEKGGETLRTFRGVVGLWGTVARSRDAGLHGRKPVFRTVRQLVMSYVDPYVDGSGRITGYGVADLRTLVKGDWRLSERNVWEVERALIKMPHKKLRTSDRRYASILKQFRAYKAKHPEGPVTFYSNKHLWL